MGGDYVFRACYGKRRNDFIIDYGALERRSVQTILTFDGEHCWLIESQTWVATPEAVVNFVRAATGCRSFREGYVF